MKHLLLFAFALAGLTLALRADPAAASDISGKWHFVLDTPGGDPDVSGTFSAGKLALSFPYTSDESGERDTLKITGELRDGKLIGDWQFGGYNGTYAATPADKMKTKASSILENGFFLIGNL